MDRDLMSGMLGKALGATMMGVGLWMLLRDNEDEMTGEMTGEMSGEMSRDENGRIRELAGRARESTRGATLRARSWVGDSPLVAGVAALGLGAAVGALLPESEREHQLLGEYRDRAAEKARETARQAMDRGRDMAVNAVHTAAESIKQQATGGGGDGSDDRNVGIHHATER